MSVALPAEKLERLIEVMCLVQEDCEKDAMTVDGTPFTGRAVGERFGEVYAAIKAVANAVELLAKERLEDAR